MYILYVYITRTLEQYLTDYFDHDTPRALILAGVVGVGKTTLIEKILRELSDRYEVFNYTGDDTLFRASVAHDSTFIYQEVTSKTSKRALVFVDEVQKSEHVFDALKIAFDRGKISFIVSGSNPAFLDTIAKRRLQRRAEYLTLLPLSLPEILVSKGLLPKEMLQYSRMLFDNPLAFVGELPALTLTDQITEENERYIAWGGLPLVYRSTNDDDRLREVKMIVERGFEPMFVQGEDHSDTLRIMLAELHGKEFGYQGIFQKTGIRRREVVNKVIDDLINHGYLVRKKPLILEGDRRSYHSVYSYIDGGMVTYLCGGSPHEEQHGAKVEGYVHSRLFAYQNQSLRRKELWYYKPYTIGEDDKLKFLPGEIDFVLQDAKTLLPIEVKATHDKRQINITLLANFISTQKLACGIVLYGGVPFWDKSKRILYWPYWLI
jgi:predicted AAA+ superfamily ATPase